MPKRAHLKGCALFRVAATASDPRDRTSPLPNHATRRIRHDKEAPNEMGDVSFRVDAADYDGRVRSRFRPTSHENGDVLSVSSAIGNCPFSTRRPRATLKLIPAGSMALRLDNPRDDLGHGERSFMATALPGPGRGLSTTARHAVTHDERQRWPRPLGPRSRRTANQLVQDLNGGREPQADANRKAVQGRPRTVKVRRSVSVKLCSYAKLGSAQER